MENRNGLVVDVAVTQATGTAERQTALQMLSRQKRGQYITLGADKAYDTREFVTHCRALTVAAYNLMRMARIALQAEQSHVAA